jgi:hypothetical protein
MKLKPLAICALGRVLALAACDDDPLTGIETLGNTFQAAFNQGQNAVPLTITNADLNVQNTGEPFEL